MDLSAFPSSAFYVTVGLINFLQLLEIKNYEQTPQSLKQCL